MHELSAELYLRPTRIGFLTSPTNLGAVRTIMRACTCLWGGLYNPIIPVFTQAPKEWRSDSRGRFSGAEIARGYVRFFEPDVYVETDEGLLEKAGLGALREKNGLHQQVLTMKEFFEPERGFSWSEPAFGLSIQDALRQIYKTERKFMPRDASESVLVATLPKSGLSEAIFGVYPTSKELTHIGSDYAAVYHPQRVEPSLSTWRQVFLGGATTPLGVTGYGLKTQRNWHHDLLIFVFDPTRATDLIDLWNLRLEPSPVLPVPVEWFEGLVGDIKTVLKAVHRPVAGNPNGMMHTATVEFGRSIPRERAEDIIRSVGPGLPRGALAVKYWRNAIWVEQRDERSFRNSRLVVSAQQRRIDLTLKGDREPYTTFETLSPEFLQHHSKGDHLWVNVLRVSDYANRGIATVLPFNMFDRSWPRLGLGNTFVAVGSEGWVFPQMFSNLGQYLSTMTHNAAIVGSLELLGITAKPSEPGHIARQMLEQLGGLGGVGLLAHVPTLELLNKMAGNLRRRSNEEGTVEEQFDLRTAPLKDWTNLIAKRKGRHQRVRHSLEQFTVGNVIRLGLETDCPHCSAKNWSTLTSVDYVVTCERCLKAYDFPQASLRDHNRNFTYRVIGPFSVPDYGRGSYSALLALRVLGRFNSSTTDMTFSTAMDLCFDGVHREVDFIAWLGDDRIARDSRRPPRLVIGEAKSLGRGDLITSDEVAKLRAVATKLPGAAVVVAVLRDHFTSNEKRALKRLAEWGRRPDFYGQPTNPLLLLTSHELTMDFLLSSTWKDLGGTHARFAGHEHTRSLVCLADATQQIYLGLPSFAEARREHWNRQAARRGKSEKLAADTARS